MKYSESIERSVELLRQALPMMSRQAAALHPVSYAVWYGYVADERSPLHDAVEQHLQRHGRLDEAATQALYDEHVAELDPSAAQRVAEGFQSVLDGMSASATLAGDQTARYGQALSRLSAELPADALPALDEVREHTRQMQDGVARLQQRLADSQREIGHLRDEVRRARDESLLDSLTGLANRRAFDQRLAACLAGTVVDPDAPPPCLVMADIDHFKRVNDTYGHVFGDHVLRSIAQVLDAVLPKQALAARVGGEEFALLLPGTGIDAAGAVAEKVRSAIAGSRIRRKGSDEVIEHITISLGVTPYRHGESPAQFIDRADQALYASKSGGRDRVTVRAD